MENTDMKKCPYCAEWIKSEAVKCRYCGSDLTRKTFSFELFSTPGYWHRVDKGKKVAGVCTGIARQLDSPILILPLRLFFVLTTIFYGFGVLLYIILWILMPPPPHETTETGTRRTAPEPESPAGAPAEPDETKPETGEPDESGKTADAEAGKTTAEETGNRAPAQPETADASGGGKSADDEKFDSRGGPGGSGATDAEFIEIRDDDTEANTKQSGESESKSDGMKRISNRLRAGGIAVIMLVTIYLMLLSRMIVFTVSSASAMLFVAGGLTILAGFALLARSGSRLPLNLME